MTNYMAKIIEEKLGRQLEHHLIRDIKEKLGCVALDFESDMDKSSSSSTFDKYYELPDGEVIEVGNERFRATEILFQPSFLGIDSLAIHDIAYESMRKSDLDLRRDFLRNFVCCGANTMFPGFADRLYKEIVCQLSFAAKVKIIAEKERSYGAWIGGASLANISTYPEMAISKLEYDECGPFIVHRKCF